MLTMIQSVGTCMMSVMILITIIVVVVMGLMITDEVNAIDLYFGGDGDVMVAVLSIIR